MKFEEYMADAHKMSEHHFKLIDEHTARVIYQDLTYKLQAISDRYNEVMEENISLRKELKNGKTRNTVSIKKN